MKNPNWYANRRLNPPKAFWEWCYKSMPTYIWESKERRIVASTRKHFNCQTKRLTKNSKLDFSDTRKRFQIVLCTKARIEIHTYTVYSNFKQGIQSFDSELTNLEVFMDDEHIKMHYNSFEDSFEKGLVPVVAMGNYNYPDIYDNDLAERLSKTSPLRYLDISLFYIDDIARMYIDLGKSKAVSS